MWKSLSLFQLIVFAYFSKILTTILLASSELNLLFLSALSLYFEELDSPVCLHQTQICIFPLCDSHSRNI